MEEVLKNHVTIHAYIVLCFLSTGLKAQTVQDIDGNTYPTIMKDSTIWMAENLKTTRFIDGTAIPLIEDSRIWETLTQPACCWLFNDETRNGDIGILYNWYAVETGRLCPVGWHVPSDKIYLEEAPWPGGSRDYRGSFVFTGDYTSYWTSTEESFETAYATQIMYDGNAVNRYYTFKNTGLLVRCVKNKDQE